MEVAPGQGDPRRSRGFGLAALASLGVFGALSGARSRLTHAPLLHRGHGGAFWLAATGCLAVVVVAYGVVWPIGTETVGRPRTPWSWVFGLVWGLTQGIVFLGVYALSGSVLVTIVAASAFQGVWHAGFWDRHVSPPHNDPAWNARKVAFATIDTRSGPI